MAKGSGGGGGRAAGNTATVKARIDALEAKAAALTKEINRVADEANNAVLTDNLSEYWRLEARYNSLDKEINDNERLMRELLGKSGSR